MKKINIILGILAFSLLLLVGSASATRQEIYTTGAVTSFGTYSFTENINFLVTSPGEQEIGSIIVDGTYNGEYPWIIRVYTDNKQTGGVSEGFIQQTGAGLVSSDGKFFIPIAINCPNFGNEWLFVPDINDPGYQNYIPPSKVDERPYNECIIMGIDPRNANWVAGPDRILFSEDDNPLGDTTLETPFEIRIRANFDRKAVAGDYTANLYIEIIPAP